jgi:signal transduction histidine kinase
VSKVTPTRVNKLVRAAGQHRTQSDTTTTRPAIRQRSIQRTLAVLLVIPLISLIGLWAFAAVNTIGTVLAKYHSDAVSRDMGSQTAAILQNVATERADTFVFQNGSRLISKAALDAQRAKTDAAAAAFRAGIATASGDITTSARPVINAILAQLSELPAIRSSVDENTLSPVEIFEAYDNVADSFFTLARSAEENPDQSLALVELGEGAGDESQAGELISREAAVVDGVFAAGGTMTDDEYQLFTQSVNNQQLLEQIGSSPQYWQQIPDPYSGVFTSLAFADFQALENVIVSTPAGESIPVNPATWQATVQSVLTEFTSAETTARLDATSGQAHEGDVDLIRLFGVGAAGLVAVAVSILLLLGFGRRIARELTELRQEARALAEERLPSVVSRLRETADVDVDAEAPPLALRTMTREVTETAQAFSDVRRTAIEAAVGQARLRQGVNNVFRSLARRNQSLLQRQLRMLDGMERATDDPEALGRLFRLDHLTTRMRRQAEGLIVLSGAAPSRGWREPVPVVEVLRGASGEVEDYQRVDLQVDARDLMEGAAVADVTHLLAELIENATQYSPPHTRVQVTASRVVNGYVLEVEDRGLGMAAETRAEINSQLAHPPEFDLADSDQLGLFVVSRLAARHGISVELRQSLFGGTLAVVVLPQQLVVSIDHGVSSTAPVAGWFSTASVAEASPALSGEPRPPSVGNRAASRPAIVAALRPPTSPSEVSPPAASPSGVSPPAAAPSGASPFGGDSSQGVQPSAFPLNGATTDMGLPRRSRQAHIAPQLRNAPAQGDGQHRARSADQARSLISAMQQGWRSGQLEAGSGNDDCEEGER